MWDMTELTWDFISGLMFGLEFPSTEDYPGMRWGMVIDLGIVRIMVLTGNNNARICCWVFI